MSNQILVPSLGESITEATVSKWLKQEGEVVNSDEPLVELETDKVNVEVPSPLAGTLSSIKVKEGDVVEVGSLLGIINSEKFVSVKIDETPKLKKDKNRIPTQTSEIKRNKKDKKNKSEKIDSKDVELLTLDNEKKESNTSKILVLDTLVEDKVNEVEDKVNEVEDKVNEVEDEVNETVRKIIKEQNIDVSSVQGTGKSGRISKGDLINLMGNIPQPSKRKITHGEEETVKMTRLRLTIAKRLKAAQDSAAMLTTFNEVDMNSIIQTRQDYQEDFQKKYSIKLGFMSFFVKAAIVALKNYPAVNADL